MVDKVRAYAEVTDLGELPKHYVATKKGWAYYKVNNIEFWSFELQEDVYRVVIQGNPTKFYKGQNISETRFLDPKVGLIILIKSMGLELMDFKITQLDVGLNVPVTKHPSRYQKLFTYIPNFYRDDHLETRGTLYFKSKTKAMNEGERSKRERRIWAIYDKTKDFKKKGMLKSQQNGRKYYDYNPILTDGKKYVLRLEVRLKNGVGKTFGFDTIQGLFDELNSSKKSQKPNSEHSIVEYFEKRFNTIEMKKDIDLTGHLTKGDFIDLLVIKGTESLNGKSKVQELINELDGLNKDAKKDCKKAVNKAFKNPNILKPSDEELELKSEIKKALVKLKTNKH